VRGGGAGADLPISPCAPFLGTHLSLHYISCMKATGDELGACPINFATRVRTGAGKPGKS